jgi:cytochrome c5
MLPVSGTQEEQQEIVTSPTNNEYLPSSLQAETQQKRRSVMKKFFPLVLMLAFPFLFSSTAVADNTQGQGVYMNFCAPCHASGVAGAPKVGDKAAWQGRIGKGEKAMAALAIRGFQGSSGSMPAKGGNSALTDEEVTSATIYMVEQSK